MIFYDKAYQSTLMACIIAVLTPTSFAASSTSNLAVTATVSATCSISTTAVSFGQYDLTAASGTELKATGTLQLSCTQGSVVTNITLGTGANASTVTGFDRAMASGSSKIGYDLYRPVSTMENAACSYTTKWNESSTFALEAAPTNASRTYNVCGRTLHGQSALPGSYTDNVVVTIFY